MENYFRNEEERTKFVLDTIDKLLPFMSDYDSFAFYELYINLEKDIVLRKKYNSVTKYIESYLLEKKMIENVQQHLHYKLTDAGRIAKKKGSLKRYEKSLKSKWTSNQIFNSVVSTIGLIIALSVAVSNHIDKNNSKKQRDLLQKQFEALNVRLKKLENKKAP
ncbi:hypothetical protein [Chryseobacterium culicis]|uniref:hypothetical protein n=1 Tax=Chryseobacterium culicis TaxID=680127 RepID=UPI001874A223|nr:hypothetical protein [Chryseobacterium culicis]MBE4949904.1 hypothetical protein [Chryseobacterium culicis]